MPKGYWIVRVSIKNAQNYPDYLAAAVPAFEKYGAKFRVRGGRYIAPESTGRDRNVVVEFEDIRQLSHAITPANMKRRVPSGRRTLRRISLSSKGVEIGWQVPHSFCAAASNGQSRYQVPTAG